MMKELNTQPDGPESTSAINTFEARHSRVLNYKHMMMCG